MLFNILNAFIGQRINSDEFSSYMEIVSESYLLNLIAEEVVETDDEQKIELIINNSLFKVQAEKRKVDTQPIKDSLNRIINNIKSVVPSGLRKVFGQTGFLLTSNQAISNFIDERSNELLAVIASDDFFKFLEWILILFSSNQISEVISPKLTKIDKRISDFFDVARLWIEGREIEDIKREWEKISDNTSLLNVLLSDGFYYRYTWGITAFITILSVRLNVSKDILPEGIKNISGYLKYGVNNASACLARSVGIRNRDVALLLADESGRLSGRDFIKWLGNLTLEDINLFNLNIYDRNNVLSISNKLTTQRYREIPLSFQFNIKGISFEELRRNTSRTIAPGDLLTYSRETSNQFDPYAIKLYKDGSELGYVPKEYSRLISVEIDINNAAYEINVVAISRGNTYNDIYVQMIRK